MAKTEGTGQSWPETPTPEAALRRGRLKNGNPTGDFMASPRCGAKTRGLMPCRAPAMANGRCRMHGGASTGAKTAAGKAHQRAATTRHGRYSIVEREFWQATRLELVKADILQRAIKAIVEIDEAAAALAAVRRTRRQRVPAGHYPTHSGAEKKNLQNATLPRAQREMPLDNAALGPAPLGLVRAPQRNIG